jgi:hypothetical protein
VSARASETRQPVVWSTPQRVRTGRAAWAAISEEGGPLVRPAAGSAVTLD